MDAGGGSIKGFGSAIMCWQGNTVGISTLVIEARAGVAADTPALIVDDGQAALSGAIDITTTGVGIEIANCNLSKLGAVTITDAAVGIKVKGLASYGGDGTTAFVNCTADANIPLNEIQYSGAYVSDNTAALAFKA